MRWADGDRRGQLARQREEDRAMTDRRSTQTERWTPSLPGEVDQHERQTDRQTETDASRRGAPRPGWMRARARCRVTRVPCGAVRFGETSGVESEAAVHCRRAARGCPGWSAAQPVLFWPYLPRLNWSDRRARGGVEPGARLTVGAIDVGMSTDYIRLWPCQEQMGTGASHHDTRRSGCGGGCSCP